MLFVFRMKHLVNPFLLVIVVVLFALVWQGESAASPAADAALWLLVLCTTGCLVNGALCLARGLSRRPVVMPALWSMAYLILGSVAWLAVSEVKEGQQELYAGYTALKKTAADAVTADESGECLLTYAAALGKTRAVRRMLEEPAALAHPEVLTAAALRAAECGQTGVLELLVPQYVAPNAVHGGLPLLVGAAVNGRLKTATLLLDRGADINAVDAEGNTPLLHAVINEDVPMARLLLSRGADRRPCNAEGRSVASEARGEVEELLQQPAA